MNLQQVIKEHDRDRYLCSLFADAKARAGLYALYACNIELAKIPEITNEPMIGMIRLQWWQDAIEEIYSGKKPRSHEVVTELAVIIKDYDLPQQLFLDMINARHVDLEAYPIKNYAELEKYCKDVSSSLFKLSGKILGAEAQEILEKAGLIWALTGIMRSVKFHAQHGKCYLPEDMLKQKGIDLDNIYSAKNLHEIIKDIHRITHEKLENLRKERKSWDKKTIRQLQPVLLLMTIACIYLKRIEKSGFDVINGKIEGNRTAINFSVLCNSYFGRF